MGFKIARREKVYARIGLCGPSGAGKSHSALRVAKGLAGPGGKILYICTEQGSAKLEAGKPGIPEFGLEVLEKPYTPQRYMALIDEAMSEKPDVLIIDSLSHAWAGQGGVLEMVDRVKSGGNNFTAWRELTPLHNRFVETILSVPSHVIVTMRTKTDYVTEKDDRGRMVVKKVGLAPVQRDGMEYEFTLVFDIDRDKHYATASKDRTSLFDAELGEVLTEQHGAKLRNWLNAGVDKADATEAVTDVADAIAKREPVVEELLSPAAKNKLNTLAIEAGFKNINTAIHELNFGQVDTMEDGKRLAALLQTKKAS